MTTKSNEGLQEYIDNLEKYTPTAVRAAVDELKKRGRVFTDDEVNQIESNIEKHQVMYRQWEDESGGWLTKGNRNIVDDPSAPEYYSERAVYAFSLLFNVFFGSVLVAMNINRTENKKSSWTAFLFGIGYTGLQIITLSNIPRNIGLTYLINFAGALLLHYFFLRKYIDKDTKYRARPTSIPFAIALAITIPLLYFTIVYGQD